MITGSTKGRGGTVLARYLADERKGNDFTELGESRKLVSETIEDQIIELSDIVSHVRSNDPLFHVHANPSFNYSDSQWSTYWDIFEKEFGLENQAFSEAIHVKKNRKHKHRVYSLVRSDGTSIPLAFNFIRQEKVSRLAELANGEEITNGKHKEAIISHLTSSGRADYAEAIAQNDKKGQLRFSLSPPERKQQERTGINKATVASEVLAAWKMSEASGTLDVNGFRDLLGMKGLRLTEGDKTSVVVDSSGNVHALNRLLNLASKAQGLPLRLTIADISERLG